jgi:hypothetical protein
VNKSATGSHDRPGRPAQIRTGLCGLLISAWLWVARPADLPPPIVEVVGKSRPAYVRQLPGHEAQRAILRTRILRRERFTPGSRKVHRRRPRRYRRVLVSSCLAVVALVRTIVEAAGSVGGRWPRQ